MSVVLRGEFHCQKAGCKNLAKLTGICKDTGRQTYGCGVHRSLFEGKVCQPLIADPHDLKRRREEEFTRHRRQCIEARSSERGSLEIGKIQMRKVPALEKGWIYVDPNYYAMPGGQGIRCPQLSPMSLGPVGEEYGGPTLNVENAHQRAKVFSGEIEEDGTLSDLFWIKWKEMGNSSKPVRRKYRDGKPIGSVYMVNDQPMWFRYIQCRWFYCKALSSLIKEKSRNQLQVLSDLLDLGVNLKIMGYDGHDMKDPHQAYYDEAKPFGHECVIATMLMLPEEDWPWNKIEKPVGTSLSQMREELIEKRNPVAYQKCENMREWKECQEWIVSWRPFLPKPETVPCYLATLEPSNRPPSIEVVSRDCIELSVERAQDGIRVCLLNMADGRSPGGCVDTGARAMEETLFRLTSISDCLSPKLYPLEKDGICNKVLFTPQVVHRKSLVKFSCVTAPAVFRPSFYQGKPTSAVEQEMKRRIRGMLAACKGMCDHLILSAWGCGAYRWKPQLIAGYFREILVKEGYAGHFNRITFAIKDDHNSVENFRVFSDILS